MLKVLLAVLFAGSFAAANEVGFIVGSQTGLSAKFDLAQYNRAVDMAVSYHFNSSSSLSVHADYLIENARTFPMRDANPLNMYYGLGARLENIDSGKNSGKTRVGIRAPIGVDYEVTNPDITLFGELAVVLDIAPESYVDFTAGIGARLRF